MPGHDDNIWGCLCHLLNVNPEQREDIRSNANLPLVLGGVALRSASRISASAYWASWADCLPMVFVRHRGRFGNRGTVGGAPRHPISGGSGSMREVIGRHNGF